jgi:aromatic ring-opening dioxygenase catalytic subunit (LigB family)
MEESAATAALVGIVMALVKLIEKGMAKANGGSVEFRLAALEKQIEELKSKVHDFQRGFFEFREEARIKWAKEGNDE